MGSAKRLVVVPSDSMEAYQKAGYDWLERYYNPIGFFDEVFALSPKEQGEFQAHGMTVIGVRNKDFAKTLKSLQPDLVRAYNGYWAADLVCLNRVPGIPVVVSVHNTGSTRASVQAADRVFCMSQAVAAEVQALGTEPSRIRILPNRVDTNVFHPVQNPQAFQALNDRFPAGKRILHVGRKSEQKNLETVIQALPLLPTDYCAIFVGRGETAAYQQLAQQQGVADRCYWVESVQNAELPLWYSWCDCLCVPSRWEGFGIIFIEAAACGTPIITSDIAPMNEYLTHQHNACLVSDYENPQTLAKAIQTVCEDQAYRQQLSDNAIAVGQSFSREQVDRLEVDLYQELLSEPPIPMMRQFQISQWAWQYRLHHKVQKWLNRV